MKLYEMIYQAKPRLYTMMLQVVDNKGKQLYFGKPQYCGEVLLKQNMHIPTTVYEDRNAMTVTIVVEELK